MKTVKKMIPFTMLEIVSAHQIPFSPMAVPPRSMASGIRAAVKIMVMTDASMVFPIPDMAPTVISSTHMNISENPIMRR